jgi:hypothetical protein
MGPSAGRLPDCAFAWFGAEYQEASKVIVATVAKGRIQGVVFIMLLLVNFAVLVETGQLSRRIDFILCDSSFRKWAGTTEIFS